MTDMTAICYCGHAFADHQTPGAECANCDACDRFVDHRTLHRVRIGDDVYVFPPGTTREHAESVIEDAKLRYLRMLIVDMLARRAADVS